MIKVDNTKNSLGVSILGDYNDFEQLHQSLHNIIGDEDENISYYSSRLMVLGLCYDIRHAMQGDREYELISSGVDNDIMKLIKKILPKNNVYLKINFFWPDILFIQMVLNDFIMNYASKQSKEYSNKLIDRNNIWDINIATVRNFQATINECIKRTIPETKYSRVIGVMTNKYNNFDNYLLQYINKLVFDFIDMKPDERINKISIIVKRLCEKGKDYKKLEKSLIEAAKEYDCHITDLSLNEEFPEEIEW